MKIKKNNKIQASILPGDSNTCLVPVSDCKYCNAIELISAAIESLAEIAKDDQIAKDSIANLGVVLLDLKGGC